MHSHHVSTTRAHQLVEVDPSEQECEMVMECSVSEDSHRWTIYHQAYGFPLLPLSLQLLQLGWLLHCLQQSARALLSSLIATIIQHNTHCISNTLYTLAILQQHGKDKPSMQQMTNLIQYIQNSVTLHCSIE